MFVDHVLMDPDQVEAIEALNTLMHRAEEAMAASRKNYATAIEARNKTGKSCNRHSKAHTVFIWLVIWQNASPNVFSCEL